jgi:hypothetical protein
MKFNEQNHTYEHQGDEYISVTQLIKKYGLSADYANIPPDVLAKAAIRGKEIHKGLELYVNGDRSMLGKLNEVDLFDAYVGQKQIDLSTAKSELIIYDTQFKVAGTIDFTYNEDGTEVITDFKATSTLYIDSVAWQLSLYNYIKCKGDLLKYYFNKLRVLWFNGGRLSVKEIYHVDFDAVVSLLEAHKNGTDFEYVKPVKVITPSQEIVVGQILREIDLCDQQKEKLQAELKVHLDQIKQNFITHKEYNFKNNEFTLSYLDEGLKRNLNHNKVKEYLENQGQNLDDYYHTTITPSTIRVRLNKKDD